MSLIGRQGIPGVAAFRVQQRSSPMQLRERHRFWPLLATLLILCLPAGPAHSQGTPPGPTVIWVFRTPGMAPDGRFNLVQGRLHFEPGAATPWHTHPGQVVVTVLEGENTFTMGDMVHIYRAGESFIELPGPTRMEARNAGTSRMSVMATYLLPWEAPLSNPVPGQPAPALRPTTSYQFRTDVEPITAPFDVVQQELEFAPGTATPWHTHPGLVMVTVLKGELTFTYQGATTVYREGESFVEELGRLAQARNASAAPTRVMATYLLPAGAPLSHPQAGLGMATQPPAQLPNTGEGPAVATTWPGLLAGAGLLAGGWWLRRRHERR
jgi:quercetin dioxygenase-like cupin family protein